MVLHDCKGIAGILPVAIMTAVLFVFIMRGSYFSNHITTEQVDEGIYVSLDGQEQYLLIRGEDVNNPSSFGLGGPSGRTHL